LNKHVARGVVCLLSTCVSCAKTAEQIEMPFVIQTRVGPVNLVLRWRSRSSTSPAQRRRWASAFTAASGTRRDLQSKSGWQQR